MPVETVIDENGDGMLMIRSAKKSILLPLVHLEETVDNLVDMEMREDDIYLCSYAKSGCHWVWEILNLMVHGVEAHDVTKEKESYMVEFLTFDQLEAMQSPRILNNHLKAEHQPKQLFEKNLKVIYVYRNPKDVAVSFYHHHTHFSEVNNYSAPFGSYLKRFVAGQVDSGECVFDYIKGWDDAIHRLGPKVHVMCYEKMKENVMPELKRLAEFLGTSTDGALLQRIADLTDFDTMKESKGTTNTPWMVKDGNHVMYRKGQVGDWKNHFTVAENEWFDQLIKDNFKDLKFHNFRYTL